MGITGEPRPQQENTNTADRNARRKRSRSARVQRDPAEGRAAHPPRPQRRGRHGHRGREAHPSLFPASDSRPKAPAPSWSWGRGSASTGNARAAGGPHILPQNTLNAKGMCVQVKASVSEMYLVERTEKAEGEHLFGFFLPLNFETHFQHILLPISDIF